MKVIGITGGVGSGKSEVLKFLEQEYGAVVCQMDEVAKQIQRKGTQAFSRIVQEFGEQIVGNNGELLPEVGKELCDELWYIYTDEAVRRERLKSSRHYTDEKITRMIASQPIEEVFRKACTVVIDNSGDFEATKRQIGDRLNK